MSPPDAPAGRHLMVATPCYGGMVAEPYFKSVSS